MTALLYLGLLFAPTLTHAEPIPGGVKSEAFWVKGNAASHSSEHLASARSAAIRAIDVAKPAAAMAAPLAAPGVFTASQSVPWSIVLGLTLMTLLPALLLSMTPLVRLLVVFHSSTAGTRNPDSSLEPGADGTCAHDDLVLDAACAPAG